ncbi:MAG TPA: cyclic nucleotide-binding domain-containing protein, partial [Polyangiales bacterium]
DVITRAGEPQRAIQLIVEGVVELFHEGVSVTALKAGMAYGAMQMLARAPSVLGVAAEDTRIMEIPASAFELALDENYTALRSVLGVVGSAALVARGHLPVDPNVPRTLDEGVYYDEPSSLVERLIQVRTGNFAYMNIEALVDLAREMKEVRFPAGHVIWSMGDLADHSLYIDCGRVRCSAADGRHVDIGRDFTLGVLDVWGSRARAYDARSETPVIGFRIEFESFLRLLETHVEVGIQILRVFAQVFLNSRALWASQGRSQALSEGATIHPLAAP